MKAMRQLIFLPLIALLASCGGEASNKTGSPEDSAKAVVRDAVTRIRTQEDSLFSQSVFDHRGALALRDVYLAFAKNNPLDSMAPEYLFRAAGVSHNLLEPQRTMELYDRVIKDYPTWRRIPDTYYLRAFTIENDLKKKGEAQTAYQEVIDRFPGNTFAEQAAQSIKNLPYTDAELIDRFEKMNAEAAKAEAAKKK